MAESILEKIKRRAAEARATNSSSSQTNEVRTVSAESLKVSSDSGL